MDTIITIILGSISIFLTIFAVNYTYKTYWISKSPKIVIESEFPNIYIRNVGTDMAKNITERNNSFNSLPNNLWNFTGPIDYIRSGNSGLVAVFGFHNQLKPKEIVILHFDYTNTDGDKFYSEIEIEQTDSTTRSYKRPILLRWGKI
ncbi:MAG: hypothetical protein AAB837_02555 [Patescibacteria group bacterium]